jgi:hypothetical protein
VGKAELLQALPVEMEQLSQARSRVYQVARVFMFMLVAKAAAMEQVVSTVAVLVVFIAPTPAVAVADQTYEKSLATLPRES